MTTIKREEIQENRKWDTEHIFSNKDEWQLALKKAELTLTHLEDSKDSVCSSAYNLLSFVKMKNELGISIDQIYSYSFLKEDEDTTDSKRQELGQMLNSFGLRFSEFFSVITTKINDMGQEKFEQFVKEEKELEIYRKVFTDYFRYIPHTLSEKEEAIISQVGLLGNSSEIYNKLVDADMKFPMVTNDDDVKVRLTQSNFGKFMDSKNRAVRKEASEALGKTYKSFENTTASTLYSSLKEDYFYTKTSKFNSTLEASLFADEVPKDVYMNLIKTVRENIEPMGRYYDLKKKMLNLDELHSYDTGVPMVNDLDVKITYEEAYETMQEGLAVLGEDYVNKLKEAYESRWIDVYENEGKRSGGYSLGVTGVHPYVLLNHKDDMDSMFTLAHEMGHALHSHYSDKENDPAYRRYKIFVAEVASTVNEVLLMKHLLAKTTDKKMKMFLINQFLEQFRGTFFTQTMFAEFEYIIHKRVQDNEPLTSEHFDEIYLDLVKHYNDEKVTLGETAGNGWSRIPHFYRSFYVYKYATGFSAAISLTKQILEEGQPAVDRYLNFLKSGSTKAPLELLKDAGVDMSSPKPIEDTIKMFDELVTELENLA
jgi:oligoendopeptidase F